MRRVGGRREEKGERRVGGRREEGGGKVAVRKPVTQYPREEEVYNQPTNRAQFPGHSPAFVQYAMKAVEELGNQP